MPTYFMPNPMHQTPAQFDVSGGIVAGAGLAANMLMPRNFSYTVVGGGRQTEVVPLEDLDVDGNGRLRLFDADRLTSIIDAIRTGTPLPPLSVTRRFGRYSVQNGYHRFLACVILGIGYIPVAFPRPWQARRH